TLQTHGFLDLPSRPSAGVLHPNAVFARGEKRGGGIGLVGFSHRPAASRRCQRQLAACLPRSLYGDGARPACPRGLPPFLQFDDRDRPPPAKVAREQLAKLPASPRWPAAGRLPSVGPAIDDRYRALRQLGDG